MARKWILVGVVAVLIVSAVAVVFGGNYFNPKQDIVLPWMFVGAYATYVGQIDNSSTPYSINATMEVTNLNSSYVLVQTNSTIVTPFAPALSDQTALWISKGNVSFQPRGESFAATYITQIAVKGLGLRDCVVYQYTNEAINATYYVDTQVLWPLRIVYATDFENQTYTLEFNLESSNIDGLK